MISKADQNVVFRLLSGCANFGSASQSTRRRSAWYVVDVLSLLALSNRATALANNNEQRSTSSSSRSLIPCFDPFINSFPSSGLSNGTSRTAFNHSTSVQRFPDLLHIRSFVKSRFRQSLSFLNHAPFDGILQTTLPRQSFLPSSFSRIPHQKGYIPKSLSLNRFAPSRPLIHWTNPDDLYTHLLASLWRPVSLNPWCWSL
jgi:hypothetical protein